MRAIAARWLVLCAVAAGCGDQEGPRPRFVDVAESAGLTYVQAGPGHAQPHPVAMTVAGAAAVGDYDGDGWPDLWVSRVDDTGILYRNQGDGTFRDVTREAGIEGSVASNGAAFGDVDGDGDLDLYVATVRRTRYLLFVNDGAGRFVEDAVARGAAVETDELHMGWSVAFGDYDRDGYLDLHLCERQEIFGPVPLPSHTRLLHNLGAASPGHFEDVTVPAGVAYDSFSLRYAGSHAFVSTFADVDDDGWPDLLVSGDYRTSHLFWNDHDGTFTNGTVAAGVGTDDNGMGSAVQDYDGDGRLDWFEGAITCFGCEGNPLAAENGNRLYRNRGDRTFDDVTDYAGVREGWWSWGTELFDYDNDGDLDLVQTNGVSATSQLYVPFRDDPTRFWENVGGGRMREVARAVGLDDRRNGRGLMVLDYDDDGDLDVFVVNHAGRPALYRNDGGNRNAWCRLRLEGRVNRRGIGARVVFQADAGGPEQVREVRASGQYLGQSETTLHFGMGPGRRPAHRIRVRWPTSGEEQVLDDVQCNRTVVLREP